MTEEVVRPASAGAMLRAARERQGLHIAALAAAIKVPQRKLEALEADRWDELPDSTFVRALAQTVCRTLKIDARPVLELLPAGGMDDLGGPVSSMNEPFRERRGRTEPGLKRLTAMPMVLAGVALVVAAVVLYLVPAGTFTGGAARAPGVAQAASAASAASAAAESGASLALAASAADAQAGPLFPPSGPEPNSAAFSGSPAAAASDATPRAAGSAGAAVAVDPSAVKTATSASGPAVPARPASASTGLAAVPSGNLQVRTSEASWVEVRDGAGQVMVSRTVLPGEPLGLDVEPPLRLTIGNAAVTQLAFRGQTIDLKPSTRENVARVLLEK